MKTIDTMTTVMFLNEVIVHLTPLVHIVWQEWILYTKMQKKQAALFWICLCGMYKSLKPLWVEPLQPLWLVRWLAMNGSLKSIQANVVLMRELTKAGPSEIETEQRWGGAGMLSQTFFSLPKLILYRSMKHTFSLSLCGMQAPPQHMQAGQSLVCQLLQTQQFCMVANKPARAL